MIVLALVVAVLIVDGVLLFFALRVDASPRQPDLGSVPLTLERRAYLNDADRRQRQAGHQP